MMMVLSTSPKSMYDLEHTLKETMRESNYPTVRRHIIEMLKDGLLSTVENLRKNGKPDERRTKKPELTNKGLATLLIDGDLQKDELVKVGRISLQRSFGNLPEGFLRGVDFEGAFADTFLRMKPKVNLRFFDEIYFSNTLMLSFLETVIDVVPKIRRQTNVETRATAKQMKNKYVHPSQVNQLREIHQFLVSEKNRFTKLVELFDAILKESERD